MARAASRIDRRAHIAKALYACICRQGYASTSLTDIADEAKMSISHVGYYFENKGAILEYYTTGLCEQILDGQPELSEPEPERLSRAIADFCFGPGQQGRSLLGVIQEISGLAVHDPKVRRIKTHHSKAWRKYLEAYFEHVGPRQGLSVQEAARIAHAMLVGLDTNLLFDRSMRREDAHALFLRALRDAASAIEHVPAEPAAAKMKSGATASPKSSASRRNKRRPSKRPV